MAHSAPPHPYSGSIMAARHNMWSDTNMGRESSEGTRSTLESEWGLHITDNPDNSQHSGMSQEETDPQGEPPHRGRNQQQTFIYKQPLPKPRPFTGEGDRTFEIFLESYEPYARSNWGEDKASWRVGLEELLSSWALKVYRSLLRRKKTYDEMIEAIKKAFNGVKDPLGVKKKIELETTEKHPNEPLSVFHMRVSNLVAEAYPDISDYDREVRVRENFLKRIPERVVEQIANYCVRIDDFSNEAIYDGALVAETTPKLVSSRYISEGREEVNVVQTNKEDPRAKAIKDLGARQVANNEMRCYICGGSWHPVSACELYNLLFKCVLCREQPHPITECHLLKKLEEATQNQFLPSNSNRGKDQTNVRRRDTSSERQPARHYENPQYRQTGVSQYWPREYNRGYVNEGSYTQGRYGARDGSYQRENSIWNNASQDNYQRGGENRGWGERPDFMRGQQNTRLYNYGNPGAGNTYTWNRNQNQAGNDQRWGQRRF